MEYKSENIIILDFFSLFRQNLLQNVMKNHILVTLVHIAVFWLSHLWPATNNFQENSGTYMYPLVCLVSTGEEKVSSSGWIRLKHVRQN